MRAPDYNTLYEFEPRLAATLDCLFNNARVVPKSIRTAKQFQSDRPRVEATVVMGARFDNHYILDAGCRRRENGWDASLHLNVITWADYRIHYAYVAAVRELASRLDQLDLTVAAPDWPADPKNPFVALDFHEISQLKTAGSTPLYEPEKGVYQTRLNFDFQIAILPDAWPGGLFQRLTADNNRVTVDSDFFTVDQN